MFNSKLKLVLLCGILAASVSQSKVIDSEFVTEAVKDVLTAATFSEEKAISFFQFGSEKIKEEVGDLPFSFLRFDFLKSFIMNSDNQILQSSQGFLEASICDNQEVGELVPLSDESSKCICMIIDGESPSAELLNSFFEENIKPVIDCSGDIAVDFMLSFSVDSSGQVFSIKKDSLVRKAL